MFSHYIFWYSHYVDNIFFVWKGPKEKFLQFSDYVNTTHNTIKSVLHYDNTQVEFIDVQKKDTTYERIPFVTTYDIHSNRVRKFGRKYWPILMNDSTTYRVFKNYPLFAYKRGKNGNQMILCGYHTCMSKNVVYYLKCPRGKGYVGKINIMMRVRLNEHCSSIQNANSKITSVSQHWTEFEHNVSQLRWQVLEEAKLSYVNIDKKTFTKRVFWDLEARHCTLALKGLNESWGLNCFL
ncbi:hypothetical protein XELAEV_18033532mg [Xenopus laevis]|uniref:GIY-YIG domain-containing protein n=1 Tax=Xenopus laevis TaxID=8355 RepID=A0A974CJG0_XENLA|nr:hypothetical protein XELAEV_18033532mg [Xenopus laevis]